MLYFDKVAFAKKLKEIRELYDSQEKFAQKIGITRTYLSQYMNMRLNEPPSTKVLQNIAYASQGKTTYEYFLMICGYIDENIRPAFELKKYFINPFIHNKYIVEDVIENVIDLYNTCPNNLTKNEKEILNTTYYYIQISPAYSTYIEKYKNAYEKISNIKTTQYFIHPYSYYLFNEQEKEQIDNIIKFIESRRNFPKTENKEPICPMPRYWDRIYHLARLEYKENHNLEVNETDEELEKLKDCVPQILNAWESTSDERKHELWLKLVEWIKRNNLDHILNILDVWYYGN